MVDIGSFRNSYFSGGGGDLTKIRNLIFNLFMVLL